MPNLLNPYRLGVAEILPSALTGIAWWLRADDLNAAADASSVSSWVDRIASYNFAQATGSKQPTFYKTTSARLIGGKQTVSFDGGDLLRYAGIIGSPTSGHIIVVCQINTVPGVGGNAMIVTSADEATTTRVTDASLARPTSDTLAQWIQRDNDTGDTLRGDTALNATVDYVLEFASSGTLTSMRVNGVAQTITVAAGVNNGDWVGDTSARDSVCVGARKNTSEAAFFAGDIAEIIVINDATMTAGERAGLSVYLTNRYGIAL